jgi:N-acyl-D-amino-acid deacylase
LIVDGTGNEAYHADIAIKDGKIINIEKKLDIDARLVVNASGLVVSPGFIDMHSHNDLVPFMNDRIQNLKLSQGVTTELVGQCGLGVVPCVESESKVWKNYVRGVVGDPDIKWKFPSLSEYVSEIASKGLKNNYAALISHGAIRTSIMGFENRKPTEIELNAMCEIVRNAMKSGTFGMSIGLQYMPAVFSSKDELVSMCRVVKSYNGIIMVHLRNHDSTIVKALDEIISIAEISGVKLHISHLRSYNSVDYGKSAEVLLRFIDRAANKGIDITFDEHLYLSGSTLMTQLLPPWLTDKGTNELIERLKDKQVLLRIEKELNNKELHYPGWDNYSAITGWDGVLITSLKKPESLKYIGKTVGHIAKELGIDPLDFVAQLLIKEETGVGIVTLNVFSEEDTFKLIKHHLQMVGSDSIPAGVPHPRLYGNYPLFIGKYVREKKILSLEEAIYKSTTFPAKTLGLKDIGQISVDKIADITIFDFNEITGYEDYNNPTKMPIGIKYVILNGKIALKEGNVCEETYGRVLKYTY